MKLEVWRDIEGYPNYQVSNYGNVKSKERYTKQRNGINLRKEKLLKLQKDKKEYMYVRLYNENGFKSIKVHKLVANAFLENKYNKPTIDHIDRNKKNNNADNLRYADYKEQLDNRKIDMNLVKENMSKLGKSGIGLKVRYGK